MARVFISYKHTDPDESLAGTLADAVASRHHVFIDTKIPLGQQWGDVIHDNLGAADYLIALLSAASAESPMVVAEVEQAHALNVKNKRPGIIPIRVNYDDQLLRYPLSAYVNRFQQCVWNGPADTQRISDLILKALEPRPHVRQASQRGRMIERVRMDWIQGVLEHSLYNVARIDLGLESQAGAVIHGLDMVVQRPQEDPQPLPPGTPLLNVFDDQQGQLLILGAPGAGKTTLLLELASALLDRAGDDESHAIPVILNLSSWALRPLPLEQWIVEELRLRSDVPKKLAQEWVENEQILPLLDGLDEVVRDQREACVQSINRYRSEHGFVPIVVCSRVEEYRALTTKLRLPGAVAVQPLTRAQIQAYVKSAGQPLEGVQRALKADEGLWELLDTPLMLSVMALAYKNQSDGVVETAVAGSIEARREQMFAAYVAAMFKRRTREQHFTAEQIQGCLSWLASRMVARAQTVLRLEDIRSGWAGDRKIRFMALAALTFIVTVMSGVLGWLNFAMLDLVGNHFTGFYSSFFSGDSMYWFLTAPVGTFLALLRGRSTTPTEVLEVYWPGAKNFVGSTLKAALAGAALGSILGAGGCVIAGFPHDFLAGAQVYGLAGTGAFGIAGAIRSLARGRLASVRSSPRIALDRSMRSSILCFAGAVIVGLAFMLLAGVWIQDTDSNLASIARGVELLPLMGFFIALELGGYFLMDHFITRWLLYRRKLIPWNIPSLLDTAAERVFLRKVGGNYIFVHRTLLEYFAKAHGAVQGLSGGAASD